MIALYVGDRGRAKWLRLLRWARAVGVVLAALAEIGRAEGQEPEYTVAYASFAPLNWDLFLADPDGRNPRALLPHPQHDCNASFSADGKWIVFTSWRKGSADVYRVRPDGKGLQRLTDGPGFDDQGALSPDGKRLAFVSSRSGQADIWLLELASGALQNLTQSAGGDFRPAWSPDGKWLAFSSDRESRKPRAAGGFTTLQTTALYVMRDDGSQVRRVTEADGFAGSPVWSADGKQLLFYTAAPKEVNNIITARRLRGTTQLAKVDLATGATTVLTEGAGEKWSPQWVGQSGRIGYGTGGPEGGLRFLTGSGETEKGEFRNPHWSPDGKRMVFHREVGGPWPPFQPMASKSARFGLLRTGIFPSASADGAWILTNSQPAAIQQNRILLQAREGGAPKEWFADGQKSALAPAWSADGEWVAFGLGRFFQMFQGKAVSDIAIQRKDGTGLRVLTKGTENCGFPSWSPDGRQIVYRASGGEQEGLFVVEVESGTIRPLVTGPSNDPTHDNFPAWSPQGDWISFTSKRDGDYEIYRIRPDGTGLERITRVPGNDAHSAWSPDGQWLAFSSERQGFKDESALHPYNGQPYGDTFVMRPDGSQVQQLTDDPFEDATPAWVPKRTKGKGATAKAR